MNVLDGGIPMGIPVSKGLPLNSRPACIGAKRVRWWYTRSSPSLESAFKCTFAAHATKAEALNSGVPVQISVSKGSSNALSLRTPQPAEDNRGVYIIYIEDKENQTAKILEEVAGKNRKEKKKRRPVNKTARRKRKPKRMMMRGKKKEKRRPRA